MMKKFNIAIVGILLILPLIFISNGMAQTVVFEEQFDYTDSLWLDANGGQWFLDGSPDSAVIDNSSQLSGANSIRIEMSDAGANPWSIAIRAAMPLAVFTDYNFSFMMKASTDTAQTRCLFELAGSPYTARIDQTVMLTTTPQHFSFDYSFDGTEVPTNQIKFQVGSAQNNNTTIWIDSVYVTATHGEAPPVAGNLIANPEFNDGTNNWTIFFNGSGTSSVDNSALISGDNSLKLEVTDGGTNIWDAQATTTVPLESVFDYTAGFWAVASDSATIGVLFEQQNSPFERRLDTTAVITPQVRYFEYALDSNTVVDPTNQLKFQIGGLDNTGKTIWIDFVVATGEEYKPPRETIFQTLDSTMTGINTTSGLQGVSWVDYDNDGDMDLWDPAAGSGTLWRNEYPSLMFTDAQGVISDTAAGGNAYGSAWADIDNDGDMDLVQSHNGYRVYRNDGTVFTDISEASGVTAVDAGVPTWSCTLGDYDQDGDVDIAWAGSDAGGGGQASPTRIFNNDLTTGSPVFTDVADAAIGFELILESWAPMWVDVDNDGAQDLYLPTIRTDEPCALVLNTDPGLGELTWLDLPETGRDADSSGITSEWADFNNDGYTDYFIIPFSGDANGNARLWQNNGDLTFTDVAPDMGLDSAWTNSRGVTWGDYDNDGYQDLLISRRAGTPSQLWRNDGGIDFVRVDDTLAFDDDFVDAEYRFCQFVDFNNDGFLDIYFGGQNVERFLLRNKGNSNHWIGITPEGVTNNWGGIGARVKVVSGSLSMIRDIQAGAGGGGANGYLRGQFGLGSNASVDSVIVFWPNGLVDRTTDIPAGVDRYYRFVEGQGLVVVGIEDEGIRPLVYSLSQNYPNPFNPTTTIKYKLPQMSDVKLVIYNILGQKVRTLIKRQVEAGAHSVVWDGHNDSGIQVATGVYIYRFEAGDFVRTKKMMLLK
jgi:hypothetical protein